MAEESIVEENLQTILSEICKSIRDSDPDIGEKQLKKRLVANFVEYVGQNFFVEKNKELDSFLKDGNKSIREELNGFSRTYFLERINKNDEIDYLGFVTIRIFNLDISDVDIKVKKKLILSGKSPKNIDCIPCYLIEQVAKNSNVEDNPICVKDLLDLAMGKIIQSNNLLGSALVTLLGVNIDKVINIYSEYGFEKFGELKTPSGSTVSYQPMYLKLPTGIDSLCQ